MPKRKPQILVLVLICVTSPLRAQTPAGKATSIAVDWSTVRRISQTTPTLQVVVNPPLRRGSSIHDAAFESLHDLHADFVRYVPWLPYPKLAVAELAAPTADKTSWDFNLIDPTMIDFFKATQGHSVIINFSTIPQWMFKTPSPVDYPSDPNEVFWNYTKGTELRDPSMKELGGYYARLVSWYSAGGFTDEIGHRHESGYHYSIPYWEVFNEIEYEHDVTPQQYTERYDAVVASIHSVSPDTKFVGLALATAKDPSYFEYFLDHRNHKPGTPLDMISYHFYSEPKMGETANQWQNTFFTEAADFLLKVRQVEAIRKRLSPETKTTIDELGVILPGDNGKGADQRILPIYWNAAGATYAYLYVELSKLGIDVVGESQLVGYPTQFPSVSLIDWSNGKPNARFWILKLLKDNFAPGDSLMSTTCVPPNPRLEIQAYKTPTGQKLLLINKSNLPQTVALPGDTSGGRIEEVDLTSGETPARSGNLEQPTVTLTPFEVAVIHELK